MQRAVDAVGVQVGRARDVRRSTRATVLRASTTPPVCRTTTTDRRRRRRTGVGAPMGSGVRRVSGGTHASASPA